MITAAASPKSNVIIKQPVKLILQGHAHGAGLVWATIYLPDQAMLESDKRKGHRSGPEMFWIGQRGGRCYQHLPKSA